MKYPMCSNWLTIRNYRFGQATVKNEMTGKTYRIDPCDLKFLLNLDGRTNPYTMPCVITAGYSWGRITQMLQEFSDCGLTRSSMCLEHSFTSLYRTVYIPKKQHSDSIWWKILNMILWTTFLPAIAGGLLLFLSSGLSLRFDLCLYLGLLAGFLAGSVLHEFGHVIATLATGGNVYEVGVSLTCLVFPGAYAAAKGKESASPLQKAQIYAAGMEENLMIAGIMLILSACGLPYPEFFAGIAIANMLLTLDNLLFIRGLDGCRILSVFFGLDISISAASRYMLFNRRKRRRLIKNGCPGKASLCSYCLLLLFQLAGLTIYPLVIVEVILCLA